ncbi:hypothetical protein OZX65_00945 [Leuconostocaceae bacterium ESL0723]|nr:hypothetical protein OZX65_00945 [Leuconostocaceae bacterium ESL0723]
MQARLKQEGWSLIMGALFVLDFMSFPAAPHNWWLAIVGVVGLVALVVIIGKYFRDKRKAELVFFNWAVLMSASSLAFGDGRHSLLLKSLIIIGGLIYIANYLWQLDAKPKGDSSAK